MSRIEFANRLLVVSVSAAVIASVLSGAAAATPDPDRPPVSRIAGTRAETGRIVRPLDPAAPEAGSIRVGYERHRARGRPVGTILAIEGGPGYATTSSRDYYLELFRPLLADHDLLLIDSRGTGSSSPIRCRRLQSYRGNYLRAVRRCGRQLGSFSDVYGSAFVADDFVAVLDRLQIDQVDVYGDSYGTFLGQAFAVRHPDRVRSLTLDAAYPVAGQDPLYPDLNRAIRSAFRVVCERDEECRGDPVRRFRRLAERLDRKPLRGRAYDADGVRRTVVVDAPFLAYLMGTATYGTTVYEELDTAGRAWLRRGDPAPLLRIAAEQDTYGGAGPVRDYSEGAYLAVTCHDYPQLWDQQSGFAARGRQHDAALAALSRVQPKIFAPFTIAQWVASSWSEFDSCLYWPRPSRLVPAVPDPPTYPSMPTLVLVGDLDSVTSAEGSRIVAGNFPDATYVEIANVGHVTALADYSRCASRLVRRFVRDLDPGPAGCARAEYPPVRTTDAFWRRFSAVDAVPGAGSRRDRRVVNAVTQTVGDVFPRWFAMYGTDGRGLRGGRFTTSGTDRVRFRLDRIRFVGDLAVSGRITWNRRTGRVVAGVGFEGAARGHLRLRWNDHRRYAQARARGRIGGRPVDLRLPAP
ncbi:MAG: alpha/beta fold hydrolase [Nocardioides sp.]